ncbi:hypothetical protein [Pseudoxanthomonas mexicana]|uniref:hypothetical protein n=1 Tax=Pseudoxanthomonas mexicana TaxID=128785 RepID=UPI00209E48A6|nr:hypothetical protein [Pseudoxanthomonas mexicana]MCP1582025.1 hypothetical protein [Pseudoxanthomonas mexicana]
MTKALPARLPDCFRWVEDSDGRHRLMLENVDILEVRRQRMGWVVEIRVQEGAASAPPQVVAVRSPAAGIRWGARWSKARAPQLAAMVAIRRRYAPRPQPKGASQPSSPSALS